MTYPPHLASYSPRCSRGGAIDSGYGGFLGGLSPRGCAFHPRAKRPLQRGLGRGIAQPGDMESIVWKDIGQFVNHVPVEWFTPVAFPCSVTRDPRTRPGDLALLFALHTSCLFCESFDCAVVNDRLLQLTGFRSSKALYKHRRDLERWGYIAIRPRPGMPTDYGCPELASLEDEVAVAAVVALDPRTRPGHIACYLALSVLSEETRRVEWPTHQSPEQLVDVEGRWIEPTLFPAHTEATNQQVMELAGFSSVRQFHRYRRDLDDWSLLKFTIRPGRAAIYELGASAAAERELEQRMARTDGLRMPWSGARSAAQSTQAPYRRSPASLVLSREGVALRDVACALGTSVADVSTQLAGLRRPSLRLLPVLRALAGREAAANVQILLGSGRTARPGDDKMLDQT